MMTSVWTRYRPLILIVAGVLLLSLAVTAFGQDVAQDLTEELSEAQITWVNPFTGQSATVNLLRVLYVIGGVMLLIAGWRAYRIALAVAGFALGSSFGASLAASIGGGTLIMVLSSLLFGIFGMLLALFAYYAAVAAAGGYVGILATGQILLWLNPDVYPVPFYILGFVIGAAVAIALSFELIVLLTSFLGAAMLTAATGLAARPNGWLWFVGLFILGVAIQIGIARSMNENAFRRRR